MLVQLFTWLSNTLYAAPALALLGALLWGIASVLLSPCHLASIPLVVGFISGQGKMSTARAFLIALLFASGILVTIAFIGAVTGLSGRMLGDIGPFGNYAVAAIFFVVGLYLLDILPLPFLGNPGQPSFQKKGLFAAFILGLIFGVALGPCTFAYMAPLLGVVFTTAAASFLFSLLLVFAYAAGHCSVIVAAGTFSRVVQKYLNWNERSRGALMVKRMCGILVIAGGIYLIYTTRS